IFFPNEKQNEKQKRRTKRRTPNVPRGLPSIVVPFAFIGFGRSGRSSASAFEVQGQQRIVGQVRGPAVGGEHGFVERAVGVRHPGRHLVVKVGLSVTRLPLSASARTLSSISRSSGG